MTALLWEGTISTVLNDGGNWNPAQVPTNADALTIDATAPGNVSQSGGLFCLSIDFTGFTGLYTGNAQLRPHGNVTFSAGMTTSNVFVSIRDECVLTSNGQFVDDITQSAVDDPFTIADNANANNVSLLGFNGVTQVNFGANTLKLSGFGPNLQFYSGSLITYAAGARVLFEITAAGTSNFSPPTALMPGLEIDGTSAALALTTTALNTEYVLSDGANVNLNSLAVQTVTDFTFTNGNLTNVGVVNVGGNLSLSSADVTGGTWSVIGTATALSGTITNCDFSGGAQLVATNCTDGGGNINVLFVPPIVWDGSVSTSTAVAANWTPAQVPTSADVVVVDGTGANDCLGAITGLTINFTGYAGAASGGMTPYGDFTFSLAMTYTPGFLNVTGGPANITSAGKTFNSFNVSPSVAATLVDNLQCTGGYWQGGASVDIGVNTLTWAPMPGNGDQLEFANGTVSFTYDPGGSFLIQTNASETNDLISSGINIPPTTINGAGFIRPRGTPNFASLSINGLNAGGLSLFGFGGGNLSTVGDFTAIDAFFSNSDATPDMNGQTLTIGGNFDVNDTALNNGVVNVTGTAFAHNTTITNMNFGGGTQLDATDNCVDGGGNTNVNFGAAPSGAAQRGFFALGF